MAIDILSIPPMQDEAERVFSGARRTISWDRAKLLASNVEKTKYIKHWNKHDLIQQVYISVGNETADFSGGSDNKGNG